MSTRGQPLARDDDPGLHRQPNRGDAPGMAVGARGAAPGSSIAARGAAPGSSIAARGAAPRSSIAARGAAPRSSIAARGAAPRSTIPAGGAAPGKIPGTGRGPAVRGATPARVLLVGCGPGAVDLLTLRAVRAIATADVLLHDSLVTEEVLALAAPGARRLRVGRRVGAGGTDATWVGRVMAREASTGLRVVRLHGGDPSLFARLADETAVLAREGVEWEIVPGVSAAQSCAAALGGPLTKRGVASSVLIAAGTNPAQPSDPASTLVFYMAGRRAGELARELIAGGRPARTPAALVIDASLATQRIHRSSLGEVVRNPPEPTSGAALLVVGEVLATGEKRRELADGRDNPRLERGGLPDDLDADAVAAVDDDTGRVAAGDRRRRQAGP